MDLDMHDTETKILPKELAFDVDGVFADTFRVFVDTARNQYGIQVRYEDITEYDFRKVIDIDENTSQEILQKILDHPIEMGIKPIPGSVAVLSRLARRWPLLFVTARSGKDAIIQWIKLQLHLDGNSNIYLETVEDHDEKGTVLLKHGIRFFVEDRLETCYLLDKACVTPIVFEQPWNRRPHPFPVVRDWGELSEMIRW
jgi:uncharacterized HAD superfamily protein